MELYKKLKKEGKEQLVKPFAKDRKHKVISAIFLSLLFLWFILLLIKSNYPKLISDNLLFVFLFAVLFIFLIYLSFKLYCQARNTINLKIKINNYINAGVALFISLIPLILASSFLLKIYSITLPKNILIIVYSVSLFVGIPGGFIIWHILKKVFHK